MRTSGCDYTDAADHVMICWCSFFFSFLLCILFFKCNPGQAAWQREKKTNKKTILLHLAKMK